MAAQRVLTEEDMAALIADAMDTRWLGPEPTAAARGPGHSK
jgi:hypothetical protein